jgi:hypothetical protein
MTWLPWRSEHASNALSNEFLLEKLNLIEDSVQYTLSRYCSISSRTRNGLGDDT